jgi:hypothetical protein
MLKVSQEVLDRMLRCLSKSLLQEPVELGPFKEEESANKPYHFSYADIPVKFHSCLGPLVFHGLLKRMKGWVQIPVHFPKILAAFS